MRTMKDLAGRDVIVIDDTDAAVLRSGAGRAWTSSPEGWHVSAVIPHSTPAGRICGRIAAHCAASHITLVRAIVACESEWDAHRCFWVSGWAAADHLPGIMEVPGGYQVAG